MADDSRYMRELPVRIANTLVQKSMLELDAARYDMLTHLISVVRPEDEPGTIYSVSIGDYYAMKGCDRRNGQNYKDFKEHIDAIDKIRFWVKIDGKKTRLQWFHRLRIEERNGTIEYSFNEDVVPYLYKLQGGYTNDNKLYSMALESKYSKRLYRYLKSILNMGGITISIEDFCVMACPNPYKDEYKALKRRVLDAAQQEINEITDLVFIYKPIKRNSRRTTHIQITVVAKAANGEKERRQHAHNLLDGKTEDTP